MVGLDEGVGVAGVSDPVCGAVCVSSTFITTVALDEVVGVDVVGGRGTVVVVVVVVVGVSDPVCGAVCVSSKFVTTLSFTSSWWIAIVRESMVCSPGVGAMTLCTEPAVVVLRFPSWRRKV